MNKEIDVKKLVEDQIAYYDALADEYDDAFARKGRWSYGPIEDERWLKEWSEVRTITEQIVCSHSGEIALDVACGTGVWSKIMASCGLTVHAIDTSPRMLKKTSILCEGLPVKGECINAFYFTPNIQFDIIMLGCWISHVPRQLFPKFITRLKSWLAHDGLIIVIDHHKEPRTFAKGTTGDDLDHEVAERLAGEKDIFRIPKVFWSEDELISLFGKERLGIKQVFSKKRFFVCMATHQRLT